MPAKDAYHDVVLQALKKEGWTITDDPLTLQLDESVNVYLDIGAENLLAAEKQGQRIAVEVKNLFQLNFTKLLANSWPTENSWRLKTPNVNFIWQFLNTRIKLIFILNSPP